MRGVTREVGSVRPRAPWRCAVLRSLVTRACPALGPAGGSA